MIIGVDVGNYATKTSEGIMFESKVSTLGNILTNDIKLQMNGHEYFLGEGEFDTEYRKVQKKNYLEMLIGAIALSTDDIENQIVIGLPLSQYKADKEKLKQLIMDNRCQKFCLNGMDRTIIISDLEVYPEGVGVVQNGFEGIVIDIGGRTTDISLVINRNGRRKVENPFSLPIGTLNLYSDFIKVINSRFGLDLKLNDADRIIGNGLKIYGEYQNIDFALNAFKEYVENLVQKIQLEYSIKTYDIALVGGGAELLFKPIKNRLPNAFIVGNSLFANANSYKKVGEDIWL